MRIGLSGDGLTPYVTAIIVSCEDENGNPIANCAEIPQGSGGGFSMGGQDGQAQQSGGGSIITTGKGTGLIPGINGAGLGLGDIPNPIQDLLWLLLIAGGAFLYLELRR